MCIDRRMHGPVARIDISPSQEKILYETLYNVQVGTYIRNEACNVRIQWMILLYAQAHH